MKTLFDKYKNSIPIAYNNSNNNINSSGDFINNKRKNVILKNLCLDQANKNNYIDNNICCNHCKINYIFDSNIINNTIVLSQNKSKEITFKIINIILNTFTNTLDNTDNIKSVQIGWKDMGKIEISSALNYGKEYILTKFYNYNQFNSSGTYQETITAYVRDTLNRETTKELVVTIIITSLPTITEFIADVSNNTIILTKDDETKSINYIIEAKASTNAVETNKINSVTVKTNDTSIIVKPNDNKEYKFTIQYDYNNFKRSGENKETLTADVRDTFGQETSAEITVTIIKVPPPTITEFIADVSNTDVSNNTIILTKDDETKSINYTFDAKAFTDGVNNDINSVKVETNDTSIIPTLTGTVNGKKEYNFTKQYDYNNFISGTNKETLTASVTDTLDQEVSAELTITIIKDPPPIITEFIADASNNTITLIKGQTKSINYTIEAKAVSDRDSIESVEVEINDTNDTPIIPTLNNNKYTFIKQYDYNNFKTGINKETLTAHVTDAVGQKISAELIITIIKDPPPIITNFIADVSNNTIILTKDDETKSIDYTFDAKAFTDEVNDGDGIKSVKVETNDTSIIPTPTETVNDKKEYKFTKQYDYNNFISGVNKETLTASVTDTLDQEASAELTITIIKDPPPIITEFIADASNTDVSNNTITLIKGQTKSIKYTIEAKTVSDRDSIESIEVEINDTNDTPIIPTLNDNKYTFIKQYDYNNFISGVNKETLTAHVIDTVGQKTSAELTITIIKASLPIITNFIADVSNNTITLKNDDETKSINYTFDAKAFTDGVNDGIKSVNVQITDTNNTNDTSIIPTPSGTVNGKKEYKFIKQYDYNNFISGANKETLTASVTDTLDQVSILNDLEITIIKASPPIITNFRSTNSINNNINKITLTQNTSAELFFKFGAKAFTSAVSASDGFRWISINTLGMSIPPNASNEYTLHWFPDPNVYKKGVNKETITLEVCDTLDQKTSAELTLTIIKAWPPIITNFFCDKTNITLKNGETKAILFTVDAEAYTDGANDGFKSVQVKINGINDTSINATLNDNKEYTFTIEYDYNKLKSSGVNKETLTATVIDTLDQVTTSKDLEITIIKASPPIITSFSSNKKNNTITVQNGESKSINYIIDAKAFTGGVNDADSIRSLNIKINGINDTSIYATLNDNKEYTFTKQYDYNKLKSSGVNKETLTATVTDTLGQVSISKDLEITIIKASPPIITNFITDISNNTIILTKNDETKSITYTINAKAFTSAVNDTDGIKRVSIAFQNSTPFILDMNNDKEYKFTFPYNYNYYKPGENKDTVVAFVTDTLYQEGKKELTITIIKDPPPTITKFEMVPYPDFGPGNNTVILPYSLSKPITGKFTIEVFDYYNIDSLDVKLEQNGFSSSTRSSDKIVSFKPNKITNEKYEVNREFKLSNYTFAYQTIENYIATVIDSQGQTASKELTISVRNPYIDMMSDVPK